MCEYNDGDLFGVCIALVALVFKRCHFMTWEKREDISSLTTTLYL